MMTMNIDFTDFTLLLETLMVGLQQWWNIVKISSTDVPAFKHGFLISKHVRACRHGILAPAFGGPVDEFSHLPPFLPKNLKICITTYGDFEPQ